MLIICAFVIPQNNSVHAINSQTSFSLTPFLMYLPAIRSQLDENATKITISGAVQKDYVPVPTPNNPDSYSPKNVSIWVFNPDGKTLIHAYTNLIRPNLPNVVNYTLADFEYNYSYMFDLRNETLVDKNLLISGDYEVAAIYNKGWQSFSSFNYSNGNAANASNSHYFVLIANDTHLVPIRYIKTGGISISSIQLDPSYPILHISGKSTHENSTLTLELPRFLIDSKIEANDTNSGGTGADKKFTVISGGLGGGAEETNDFVELKSTDPSIRILQIHIESAGEFGRSIYGTQVMPEFSPLASLVIMAGVIGSMVVIGKMIRFRGWKK